MPKSNDLAQSRWSARRIVGIAALALIVLLALIALAGYFSVRSSSSNVDRAETLGLLAKIRAIHATIDPIARDYTSADQSAPIDVSAFRDRVDAARAAVVAVNGVNLSSAEGLKVRDEIATGGATVLEGFSMALDALQSDDATAAVTAGQRVDEGLAMLDSAQQELTTKAKAHDWIP